MARAGTSPSPLVSSWRWMPEISFSSRLGSIGRLRQAMPTDRASLSRSNASSCATSGW